MPRGDKQQIMEYPVRLPDLPTQRKIAAVLGALDDKIELNRRMNANLEATVQALFKSWFVDFEPFGGVMPKEWGRSDVYGLAEIIYGAPFKSNLFNEKREGRPIIRIRDLKENATDTFTTEHHPKELLVHAGDIVVGMDGEFRPYIWGNYDVLLNQRLCVFKPPLNPADRAFLYFTLKPLLMAVEKTQVATTVIHIGKGDFDRFEILMPPRKTLDEFAAMAEPLVQKTVVGRVQIHTLAQLRDALLPKVISGELSADGVKVD